MPVDKIKSITGTWGGILSGIAALITAIALSITNTADEKAKKADDKSELVLDLVKAQFEFAEKERARLREDLDYQRDLNIRVFAILDEVREELRDVPRGASLPSAPAMLRPLSTSRESPEEEGAKEEDPLLSLDDLLFPSASLRAAPELQQVAALPENLEDVLH